MALGGVLLLASMFGASVAQDAATYEALISSARSIGETAAGIDVQEFGDVDDSNYCYTGTKHGVVLPATSVGNQTLSLVHVSMTIRHGDRMIWSQNNCWPSITTVFDCDFGTMERTVPIDINDTAIERMYLKVYDAGPNIVRGTCIIGQLSKKGYRQVVQNGKILKKTYIDSGFLPKKFDAGKIWLRSDNDQRTIQSLAGIMDGMYPASMKGNISEVVSIHSMEMLNDPINLSKELCPKSTKYSADFKLTEKYLLHQGLITTPLSVLMSNFTETDLSDVSLNGFSDCARVLKCWNKKRPDWLDNGMYQQLVNEHYWQSMAPFYYPNRQEASKVLTGFMIREMTDIMQYKVDPTSISTDLLIPGYDRQMNFFSSHDTTILAILVALGFDGLPWPHYATLMHLELYRITDSPSTHYVRLVYNGEIMSMPFCADQEQDGLCPYEVFAEYIKTITLTTTEQEEACKVSE